MGTHQNPGTALTQTPRIQATRPQRPASALQHCPESCVPLCCSRASSWESRGRKNHPRAAGRHQTLLPPAEMLKHWSVTAVPGKWSACPDVERFALHWQADLGTLKLHLHQRKGNLVGPEVPRAHWHWDTTVRMRARCDAGTWLMVLHPKGQQPNPLLPTRPLWPCGCLENQDNFNMGDKEWPKPEQAGAKGTLRTDGTTAWNPCSGPAWRNWARVIFCFGESSWGEELETALLPPVCASFPGSPVNQDLKRKAKQTHTHFRKFKY